jgi:hypothetical protein
VIEAFHGGWARGHPRYRPGEPWGSNRNGTRNLRRQILQGLRRVLGRSRRRVTEEETNMAKDSWGKRQTAGHLAGEGRPEAADLREPRGHKFAAGGRSRAVVAAGCECRRHVRHGPIEEAKMNRGETQWRNPPKRLTRRSRHGHRQTRRRSRNRCRSIAYSRRSQNGHRKIWAQIREDRESDQIRSAPT